MSAVQLMMVGRFESFSRLERSSIGEMNDLLCLLCAFAPRTHS